MKKEIASTGKFTNLRKRAQVLLTEPKGSLPSMAPEDIKRLVHELDTYQVELELQNEDLRLAQEELSTSRKKFSDLYEFAPVGYLTISDKGLIIEANLKAADMLGLDRGRLINQALSSFITAQDQNIYYHHRKQLIRTSQTQMSELKMQQKDGKMFDVSLQSIVSSNVDGFLGQFRTVLTDISEQKQLENSLQESKERWEKTFDAMSDIVTLMDKDLRIIKANKAAYNFFKFEPGKLTGQYYSKLYWGDSIPGPDCPVVKTLQDKQEHYAEYVIHKNINKVFHVTSSPVLNQKGEIQYLVHCAKDVTEIKKLQEELFQSQKMESMGVLAGGIAHDFNNILAVIYGYSELVKGSLPDLSPVIKDIDQVLKASNRAKELIKQILTFSQKSPNLEKAPLRPKNLVLEVIKMMRASLPSTIEIKEEVDPHACSIMANPTHFHQVIVNLFTNAYQAIENEKGLITIRLTKKETGAKKSNGLQGPRVELEIQDSGCGMDETIINRIFEPYFTTKKIGKGSGIGLAMVHGIVKDHGGYIQVESEVGKGSTFRLSFPSIEEELQHTEVIDSTASLTGTERILIIDDEKMLTDYLKTFLERLGYKVTAHTSSLEALEDFRSRPNEFDLVITDQTMPNLTGSELSKNILQERDDLPIILCTGYSSMISDKDADKLGISSFLIKPVEMNILTKIIRRILDSQDIEPASS